MRRNNHHHHHQHHTHMDWESVRSGPRQEQPPPPPYHFPHRYDRLAVTAVPSAAAAAALPAVPSLAQISAAHQTPPVQSSPAPTITGVSMQNATQGLQHRAQHGPSIALPTESAEPGLARPASAVPTTAPTSRMRHNPYQMHTDPTAMREPGPYQPPLRSAHGYAVPVSRPAYMMEHLPPPPRPVSGYWPDTQPASPFVAAGFPSTSHMRPVDRAYHSGGAMRGPTLHRGGFSQRGPQPPLWDSPPMAPLEPRWPPPPMALRPPPPMALRPPPPRVRPPPAVQQHLDRQLDRLNRLILRHARNRHPFIDTSDSDASDMADDSNFCTLCFADEAVWHCSEDDTAVCEECLERLVGDMQPGPLCCPDCRAGLIPAKLIEEHLPQTVVEKYRTRRSAGIRGDANQWLQSAVRALIAGEPAPQPWLPSSKASRPVRGHSPAETTYESALMDRLGGEAQQQVQRTWERLRSISCKETLTKELTRLEDESLAIACPSAKMCPRCNYGPVLKTGCDDLAQHHGERQTSNCCRGCGFFAVEVNAWKSWDFVNRLDLPNGPAVDNDISRLAACASVSEHAAINAIRSSNGNLDAAFDLLIRGSVVRNHQQQFHALPMPAGWTRW